MPRIKWSADMGPEWDIPRFKRNVRLLRKRFPTPYRVIVKLIENADIRDDYGNSCHAITIPKANSYEIQVGRVADISMCNRWLFEEWAHVHEPPNKKTHPNRWRDIHHKILFTMLGD